MSESQVPKSFKDLLLARKPEIDALAAKSVDNPAVLVNNSNNNFATGMQSSVNIASSLPQASTLVKDFNKDMAETAAAVYEDDDGRPLRHIIKAKGSKLTAINGFFYAKEAEEVEMLDFYVSRGRITKVNLQAPLV